MLDTLPMCFPFIVTSLIKALCFLLEVALPLPGVDMSLQMSPEFMALEDVEFTNNDDSDSG